MRTIGIGIGLGFSKRFKRKLSDELLAKLSFHFTGEYAEGDLDNDLGAGVIEVTGKDWTTKYIPETDATFKIAESLVAAIGNDGFWVIADVRQDVTFAQLIGTSTVKTFTRYTNKEPYRISEIAIASAVSDVSGDRNELTRHFRLWVYYWEDLWDDLGQWKDNRDIPA